MAIQVWIAKIAQNRNKLARVSIVQDHAFMGILYQYVPIPKLGNYWYDSKPTSLHDTPMRVVH